MTETKYQNIKYNPSINLEEDLIENLINTSNYFSVSPEASKSMLEANEKAKQTAQK